MKIVAIAAAGTTSATFLYALDEEGRVWQGNFHLKDIKPEWEWRRLPALPSPK